VDIKDFILIGGGVLIAAVIAHGFWLAWRARRDPLRLDLVRDLPPDDGDDLHRLRAELPNGGARIVRRRAEPSDPESPAEGAPAERPLSEAPPRPEQRPLPLGPERGPAGDVAEPAPIEPAAEPRGRRERREPRLDVAPAAERGTPGAEETAAEPTAEPAAAADAEPTAGAERDDEVAEPPRVADVIMPERPVKAQEPRRRPGRSSGGGEARAADDGRGQRQPPPRAGAAESLGRQAARTLDRLTDRATGRGGEQTGRAGRGARGARAGGRQSAPEPRKAEQAPEELIVVNVVAPKGRPFVGAGLVEALRSRGLRYGEMNIFHRVEPMTRSTLYSVANVVEPGTFDLADLDGFRSPGVCFFMRLPGPEEPMDAFEDMLKTAREVAMRVGGELKDEQRSVMTGQTVEHYRQRITEFCRRRMSMRA
jgi:cell division protein ZipA